MKQLLAIPIIVTIFCVFWAYEDMSGAGGGVDWRHFMEANSGVAALPLDNVIVKDTVGVAGNSYIVIDLGEQLCRLYLRDSSNPKEYKISSGNPNIPKGVETTTGLFTVQTKNPKGKSRQFEDAELINWVGFNVNIGLHGLATNGYYHTLGVRPSSHGCVRISREDGKELFNNVTFGTPVLVYKTEPAVALAFTDTNDIYEYEVLPSDSRAFKKIMRQRQRNLYEGLAYVANHNKLLLDGSTIIRWGGYPIGSADSISYRQEFAVASVAANRVVAIDKSDVITYIYEQADTTSDTISAVEEQ
jgi:hypothetical protein